MRKLRRFHTEDELRRIYARPYDHTRWPEHRIRVDRTIEVAQDLIDTHGLRSVGDLSAGDGAVVAGLDIADKTVRDIVDGGDSIEQLIRMPHIGPFDLFICSETIEHLEAPWTVLEHVAQRTRWLVLSTPLNEPVVVDNYEHYWSFSAADIYAILDQAGYTDMKIERIHGRGWTYTYQLWTARGGLA